MSLEMLRNPLWRLVLLVALSGCVTFLELGRMDITTENEGQRTAPPKHMLRTGDFVVPELNGNPYLAKPPLLYWMTAGVYALTGVQNEFTGRLVTAVSAVLVVVAVFQVLRRKAGEDVGFIAALALATAPYFMERSRFAEIEQPLLLATFLAVAALHSAWQAKGGRRWAMAVAAGCCLGAATLLKGPPPWLFVGAAYVAYVLTQNNTGAIQGAAGFKAAAWMIGLGILLYPVPIPFPVALTVLVLWWLVLLARAGGSANVQALGPLLVTAAIAIAIAAPWGYMVVERLGWENIQKLINSEVVDRTHTATRINSGFPLYYIVALPVMLAPFGLLLPLQASRSLWNEGAPFYRFSLAMAWFSIAIFSLIAGKEYEYILPCIPFLLAALAYPVAAWWQDALDSGAALWFDRWVGVWRYLLPVMAVAIVIVVAVDNYHPALLTESIVLAVFVAAACWKKLEDRQALTIRVGVCAALVILGGLLIRGYRQTGEKSPKEMALLCRQLVEQGLTVEATKIYAAFNNYSELPIPIEQDPHEVKLKLEGDAPYYYITTTKILDQQVELGGYEEKIVMGPLDTHDLVLLGNQPLPDGGV
jgi:4-amino-4-deoxy-L-arabinose transferase-like glycosyltransferase